MTKIFLILFVLLVCSTLNIGKAEISEEKTDNPENTKNDEEEESASIQVVQRDVAASKEDDTLIKYDDNPQGENITKVLEDTNTTKAEAKYDAFFEDLINDSGDKIPLENRDDNNEESTIALIAETSEFSNGQDKIGTDPEDTTTAYKHDDKSQEDSTLVDEDDNNWRSAENLNSGEKKSNEATNEESVEAEKGYSAEYYGDKKIDLEVRGGMDTRQPERRQYFNARSTNFGQYRPPEEHDSDAMRRFSEMMIPRYRPVLTRTGIVYTPTLFPMQTGPSLLDRLSGRHWVQNRVQMSPETEAYKPRQNRMMGAPQYEDSKMLEDYNEYGPNTNTYSYTPARKVTTQAPPQQIAAPNKFDIFQKLVEASNHPKTQKRTFNEFPGSYHPQRQYPEGYGPFNVRRVRRNAWDEPPFQDI